MILLSFSITIITDIDMQRQDAKIGRLVATPATAEDGAASLLFDEADVDEIMQVADLKELTVAIARKGGVTSFAKLLDVIERCGGAMVDVSDGRSAFRVTEEALAAVATSPQVCEAAVPARGKPIGAVFLDRVAIEDAIRAGGSDVRVEIARAGGRPAVTVPALELLHCGCCVARGDPLWPGCAERAVASLHCLTEGLLQKLSTLPATPVRGPPPDEIAWRTSGKKRKREEAVEEAIPAARGVEMVPVDRPLPAPLGLLQKLDDPFGCVGAELPRAALEAGVRHRLRDLLAALRRPSGVDAGIPATAEADHAAWQILHGVVLNTAEGAGHRWEVRSAERNIVCAAAGPCPDDRAVGELAKRTRVLALLAERHGGPFTAVQVAKMCDVAEAALPCPGPPDCRYYRVPFEYALDAVGSRRVMLHDGFAYVLSTDVPSVLAAVSEELSLAVERAGDAAGLGDAFIAAAARRGPELGYHHDAGAMLLALQTSDSRLSLGVDTGAALRNAPACVHALLFACSADGSLPHDARVELVRCLSDCGNDPDAVGELVSGLMKDPTHKDHSAAEIAKLTRSYARHDGARSSRCSVLQSPWRPGVVCSMPAACPYPVLLAAMHAKETPQEAETREALAASFLAWMRERSAARDVEDLMTAKDPFSACRYHIAKLVPAARIPDANLIRITSPADFLKFVLAVPKPN